MHKRFSALAVMMMFILSVVPLAVADEGSGDSGNASSESSGTTSDTSAREDRMEKRVERREEIKTRVDEKREEVKERVKERVQTREERIKAFATAKREKSEDIRSRHGERLDLGLEKCKTAHPDAAARCEEIFSKRKAVLDKISEKDLQRINRIEEQRLNHAHDEAELREKIKGRALAKEKKERADRDHKAALDHFKDVHKAFKEKKDAINDKRDELKACKGKETPECDALRDEVHANAKEHLLNAAEMILAELDRIKARVEASEDLSDERAAEIIASIDASIAKVEAAKAKIEALSDDATSDEIKAAAKELRDAWKDVKGKLKNATGRLVNSRIGGIIVKVKHMQRLLDHTLQKAAEQGKDVTAVDGKVADFNAKIDSAKTHYDAALAAFKASDNTKGHDELKASHQDLKDAHQIFVDIMKTLRGAGVEVESDESVEAELEVDDDVAEETEDAADDVDDQDEADDDADEDADEDDVNATNTTS